MQKLTFTTKYKSEMIEITDYIKEEVIKSGVKDGVATIFMPHTTASIMLFEKIEPNSKRDFLKAMTEIFSNKKEFLHENTISHVKSALLRNSISLIVENAQVVLGEWQGLYLVEFDGGRERNILVKVING
jgi:secondary thiamine-phosphate synthase enzyme